MTARFPVKRTLSSPLEMRAVTDRASSYAEPKLLHAASTFSSIRITRSM